MSSFYDDVLRELLVAVGGALFVGNLLALLRRQDRQAPIARTVTYLALGFVVMVAGLGSIVAR